MTLKTQLLLQREVTIPKIESMEKNIRHLLLPKLKLWEPVLILQMLFQNLVTRHSPVKLL